MTNYYVYKHICPNGKIYIGITSQRPQLRWRKGLGYRKQPYFFNAILKYGWDNITHEILYAGLTKDEAELKEIYLISKYKSNNIKYGYNISNGGNVTGTMSEKTKRKISNTLKGRKKDILPFKGKHHSEETKRKLSNLRTGNRNPMFGKHVSNETKIKMSRSHKNCSLCKKVMCVETGNIYISTSEVARTMNLSQSNVSAVARGKRKHAGGYHFIYINKGELTNG